MHTQERTEPIELGVIHVNVGPEIEKGASALQNYLNAIQAGYNVVFDNLVKLITASDNLSVYGAPYVNNYAKHYCLVGQADQTEQQWLDAYSRGELDLLAISMAEDCIKYGLEPRRLTVDEIRNRSAKGFCGHIDVTNAFKERGLKDNPPIHLDHWDPGPNFPWELLLNHVRAILGGGHTGVDDMKLTDKVDAVMGVDLGRYVLQADGGVANFGAAKFYGSIPGEHPKPQPLVIGKNHAVSILCTPTQKGYWILQFDGGIHTFGDAPYHNGFQKDFLPGGFIKLVASGSSYKAIRADGALATPR